MFCGTAGARGDRGQDGVEICPGGKRADDAGGECAAGNDGGGIDCLWYFKKYSHLTGIKVLTSLVK